MKVVNEQTEGSTEIIRHIKVSHVVTFSKPTMEKKKLISVFGSDTVRTLLHLRVYRNNPLNLTKVVFLHMKNYNKKDLCHLSEVRSPFIEVEDGL